MKITIMKKTFELRSNGDGRVQVWEITHDVPILHATVPGDYDLAAIDVLVNPLISLESATRRARGKRWVAIAAQRRVDVTTLRSLFDWMPRATLPRG